MPTMITRRAFGASAAVALATPFIRRAEAAAPIELRVSLDTAPSHPRNVAFRDYLSKVEAASNGQVKTKLFESGSLFPDLQVVKALVQGQVEMACPGTWTITGFVPDADFSQLPAFYGRPIDVVHKVTDGSGGKFVNNEITKKLHVEVLGGWFDLGFNDWFSTTKPLEFAGRPEGHEAAQPRRRAELLAYPLFRRHPERDCVAGRAAGHVAGHVRRADQQQREHQQLQAVRFRHAPFAAGRAGHGALRADGQPGSSGPSSAPKLQETLMKLWADNLPAWRENTAKAQQHGREELTDSMASPSSMCRRLNSTRYTPRC